MRLQSSDLLRLFLTVRYIGSEFPKLLDKPEVEYRQVNLTVPGMVSSPLPIL